MAITNNSYRKYTLDNGLVVALQNTPTQTIAAKLRINYGSSHEKVGEEGLAHFLEHCLVTGGSLTYDPLTADSIRDSFGSFNAFTTICRTNVIGQMLSEDLTTWLDYVANHVFTPRFDQERMDGERERVLREISDAKSGPGYQSAREFSQIFYRDHPKGRFTLGEESIVSDATQDIMKRFHRRGYHPNNMDLILVGELPKNVEELIKNYFGNIPKGKNTRRDFPLLTPLEDRVIVHRPCPEGINSDNPDESSAPIGLRYIGPISGHEDESSVRIMNKILGGGTNSLLFKNVGLKRGLTYSIKTSYNGDYNSGELSINARVPAKRINEAVDAIFESIQRMKTERVDDKTMERIKKIVKYELTSSFESNEGHISYIEAKLDEGRTIEEFTESFNRVTPDKIIGVSNRYLPDQQDGKYVLYILDPLMK